MDSQSIKKMALKPAINGVVAAVVMEVITDSNQKSFNFMGKRVPIVAFGAVVGVLSSLSVEVISNAVLPHIPNNQKFKHLESMVLHLAASGGVFVAAARLVSNKLKIVEEGKKFLIAGGVAEAVTSYIYESIVEDNVLNF